MSFWGQSDWVMIGPEKDPGRQKQPEKKDAPVRKEAEEGASAGKEQGQKTKSEMARPKKTKSDRAQGRKQNRLRLAELAQEEEESRREMLLQPAAFQTVFEMLHSHCREELYGEELASDYVLDPESTAGLNTESWEEWKAENHSEIEGGQSGLAQKADRGELQRTDGPEQETDLPLSLSCELTLLLMYHSRYVEEYGRISMPNHAGKYYDFDDLCALEEAGLILEECRRSRHVIITEKGIRQAEKLLRKYGITPEEENRSK